MNKKGFTLVEILAVVALIAIISVAAILGVNNIINKQKIKTATASERNIGEAALSVQSGKQDLYLPACVDKDSGNYINVTQTTLKKINDDLRTQMKNAGKVTESQKQQYIRDFTKKINNNETDRKAFSDTYIGAKDINCFKVTSVADMIKDGYLKDLDNGCDRATVVVIYNKGDSANKAGTLKTVQETGICKGSDSEEKGPLITVNPEQDYGASHTKTITVTATSDETKLKTGLTLTYGWSKSLRNKPTSWSTKTLSGNQKKVTATVSKTGMDDEYYLWIKAGSIKDDKGYSNPTFATGPYAFLPTPTITYSSRYYDASFSDPSRGHNRCNGETHCHGKTRVVIYSKQYNLKLDGSTANLCSPNCTGYTFRNWKYEELTITGGSKVVNRNNHTLTATYTPKNYTITYNSNGGAACSPAKKTVTFDQPYGTLCATSRTGYSTVGEWFTSASGGTAVNSSTRMTKASNHTIYKHWEPHKFWVAYNGNGATSGGVSTHQCTYDQSCNLKSNGFGKTNYTFNGWKLNNTGAAKAAGASIKNATADNNVTLRYYAQWCRNCISPSHGSCVLNVATPGTCKYNTSCVTGYHIVNNGTYNPSCPANTYTVKFNGNGATAGSTANRTCIYDQNCVLTANGFSRTGYRFAGWAKTTSGSVAYGNGATVKNLTATHGATVTLYAKWNPNTFNVAYNGNGASSGSVSSHTCTYDASCSLKANSYAKANSTFLGWKLNNTGATLAAGASIKNATSTHGATLTYYAQWGCKTGYHLSGANCVANTYTVRFNGNGATSGSTGDKACTYDANCVLTANGFGKTGYGFAGWAKTAGGAVAYGNKATVKNLTATHGAVVTVYAKWNANKFTVAYNGNGNNGGSVSSHTCNYDSACSLKSNGFTKNNASFAGWKKGNAGSILAVGASIKNVVTSGTVTYYAQWNCNTGYYMSGGNCVPYTYTVRISRDSDHISSVSLDGSTSKLTKTVNYGTVITISASSKDYHQFTGWSDGNTTKTNRKITVKNNITLSANGRENKSTVYYFKNGAKLQSDNGLGLATNTADPVTHRTKDASYSGRRNLFNYTAAKSNLHMKKKNCTSKEKYVVKKHGSSTKLVTVSEHTYYDSRKDQWKAFKLLDELKKGDSAVDVYPQWDCK